MFPRIRRPSPRPGDGKTHVRVPINPLIVDMRKPITLEEQLCTKITAIARSARSASRTAISLSALFSSYESGQKDE